MREQHIQQHFADSAALAYQMSQTLCGPLDSAMQAVLECLTGGGKVLACGNGAQAALAQLFVTSCMDGFERGRPGLGAVLLAAGQGGVDDAPDQVFARQLRALGQAGDVLLLVAAAVDESNIMQAVAAAHERDMTVIALYAGEERMLPQMLRETDVAVALPSMRPPLAREIFLLALQCISEGVDAQLLGELEVSE